jgi:predicted protein tyrosine phosphatase
MKVDVYNREQAVGLEPMPDTVMISISSPGDLAPLKVGWYDILRLEFHDVVRIPKDMPEIKPFHITHVDAIHEFVEKHVADGLNFAVHCDAGVSRSVAVGMFLEEIHGGDLTLHAIHTTAAANSRVSRGLLRKYWKQRFGDEAQVSDEDADN